MHVLERPRALWTPTSAMEDDDQSLQDALAVFAPELDGTMATDDAEDPSTRQQSTSNTNSSNNVTCSPLAEKQTHVTRGLWSLDAHEAQSLLHAICEAKPAPPVRKRTDGLSSEDAALSPLELRRKRNRESMQRTRLRERQELGQLRKTFEALEQQYHSLKLQHTPGSASASPTSTTALVANSNGRNPMSSPLLSKFNELAEMSNQLQEENYQLNKLLDENTKSLQRVKQVLDDYNQEKRDSALDSAHAVFAYTPISDERAYELMRQCYQTTLVYEQTTDLATAPGEMILGWRFKKEVINGSGAYFMAKKFFPTVRPREAMERGWKAFAVFKNNTMKCRRWLRQETLQEINSDTCVVGRDMEHPIDKSKLLRTIYLRFRLQNERGFVIGRSSLPSTNQPRMDEDGIEIVYADSFMWIEFAYADPSQPDACGCEVVYGGYCDYKTSEDLSSRWMNILFTILRVENLSIQPLVHLIA